MEESTVGLIVLAAGLLLIAVEAMTPGGYMLIPGIILAIVGVFGLLCPEELYSWWTPVLAIVTSVPVTALTLVLYRKLGSPEPPSTTVAGSLVGREGTVVVETTPGNMRGKVKIGYDTWSADSDEIIPVGTPVVVDGSEGVHVHVVRK